MSQVVIFDTEAEAEAQQVLDLEKHFETHSDNLDYIAQTLRWAEPKERLDGKWDYTICEHQDYTGFTLQEYNNEDYEQPEEVTE